MPHSHSGWFLPSSNLLAGPILDQIHAHTSTGLASVTAICAGTASASSSYTVAVMPSSWVDWIWQQILWQSILHKPSFVIATPVLLRTPSPDAG